MMANARMLTYLVSKLILRWKEADVDSRRKYYTKRRVDVELSSR